MSWLLKSSSCQGWFGSRWLIHAPTCTTQRGSAIKLIVHFSEGEYPCLAATSQWWDLTFFWEIPCVPRSLHPRINSRTTTSTQLFICAVEHGRLRRHNFHWRWHSNSHRRFTTYACACLGVLLYTKRVYWLLGPQLLEKYQQLKRKYKNLVMVRCLLLCFVPDVARPFTQEMFLTSDALFKANKKVKRLNKERR